MMQLQALYKILENWIGIHIQL